MILRIHEENEQENVVRLRLQQYDTMIEVQVVDEKGKVLCCLFNITPWGISRFSHVNPVFGFPLDEEGRIKVDE